jgi:signal recognition particle receptor subunit beta
MRGTQPWATTVRYGRDERVTARFRDGRTDGYPLSALDDLVTERGNPGNCRGLESVTVAVDAPVLARGVELVDTPGTGSVYAHHTAEAEMALETMDAAVFVLTADAPVSATERELMARVAGLPVTMFVALNKADYLAAAPAVSAHYRLDGQHGNGRGGYAQAGSELAEALEFATQVTSEATGRPVRVYPLSARAAVSALLASFAPPSPRNGRVSPAAASRGDRWRTGGNFGVQHRTGRTVQGYRRAVQRFDHRHRVRDSSC